MTALPYSVPSQQGQSEALGERLRRARVERWLVSVFGSPRVRAGKVGS